MPRLVVVSNRVPVNAEQAGGLAVALRSALEEMGGLWFGWSGEITRKPPDEPQVDASGRYTIATTDLTAAEHTGYYEEESNRALWPLLHGRLDLVRFRRESHLRYRAVNRRFAETLAPMLKPGDTIWVQDYHLIPLGLELRRLGVRAPIGFFLHIPFPPRQILEALPWLDGLIDALSAYDLVGFQAERDMRNFDDLMDRETWPRRGRSSPAAGVFPIGIDTAAFARLAASSGVARRVARLERRFDGCDVVIGVERLDYTKGLSERFDAFRMLCEQQPDLAGRISLLQVAAPSREGIAEYQAIQAELESLVGHINGRLGSFDWTPIRYVNRCFSHAQLAALYRFARVGLVTPLCDGMNLVAKEYVAAQDEEDPGVLVLSRFAGAAEQMPEAVLVNPYDREGTAEAIGRALAMPLAERKERWAALMATVTRDDIHAWRRAFLGALAERDRENGGSRGPRAA